MKLHIWLNSKESVGFVAEEGFVNVYDFWVPGSDPYKKNGLFLAPFPVKEGKYSDFFREKNNKSEVKFEVEGWDGFLDWLMEEYCIVDML